jgi:hypothetical protein
MQSYANFKIAFHLHTDTHLIVISSMNYAGQRIYNFLCSLNTVPRQEKATEQKLQLAI